MRLLQWSLWAVGLILQYFVLVALLRGAYREFRVVFAFVFILIATTIGDIVALYTVTRTSDFYRVYYWCAELTRQTALFAVVVSLVIGIVPQSARRRTILRWIFGGAFVFWLGSLAGTYEPGLNAWMTKVVRNLSFGSAVLDLGVWFTLISSGARDVRRLLIAGGVGLQMTGEAIGQSIRQLFTQRPIVLAGSLLVVFAHFLCLAIWLYAFRRKAAPQPAASTRNQDSPFDRTYDTR
jgi:hypothetical protein